MPLTKVISDISLYYEKSWHQIEGFRMSKELANLGYSWVHEVGAKKCLDLGCGDGSNCISLKKIVSEVQGCDISPNAVIKASRKGIKAKVVDLNHKKLPYQKSSFDLIWLTDVIEHVFWPDSLLSNIHETLAQGGHLFLTTPNVSWFINRLQILRGKTLYDIHPQHVHWFNQKRLLEILSNHGLKIAKFSSYKRIVPYPLSLKFPSLDKLNFIGPPDNVFSHTYAVLSPN